MEHRTELEDLLLAGLPDQERKQTVASMNRVTAATLAHKRAQDAATDEDGGVDLLD